MFSRLSDRARVACLCVAVPCAALCAASLIAPLTYPQMAEIVDDAVLVELPAPIAGNPPVATLGTDLVPDTP